MVDTDLNLLRVLDALLEAGSVTEAARKLHLSPSAVSRSLARLRRTLDDPLFVQVGRTFQPTPRALELRTATNEALAAVELVLRPELARDPRDIRRTFTISADDALIAGLAGALVDDLSDQAPGVTLRFITDDDHDTALDTGAADLDLGIAPAREHLRSEVLVVDHYVLAANVAGPIHRMRSLANALRAATYVDVARNAVVRDVLTAQLPPAARSVEVPSYLGAAHLVATTSDAVAILPSTLVDSFGSAPALRARRLPFELPVLTISQSWHVRNDADAAHRWLRGRVRLLVNGVTRSGSSRSQGRAPGQSVRHSP